MLVPPPGTIFTNKNNDIAERNTRLGCVFQKHTKHTLFAVLLSILTAYNTISFGALTLGVLP